MLTLLSVLARQNVDPGRKQRPRDTAMGQITSGLETLPGDPSLADRAALVEG